jgi:hypothetical protein
MQLQLAILANDELSYRRAQFYSSQWIKMGKLLLKPSLVAKRYCINHNLKTKLN